MPTMLFRGRDVEEFWNASSAQSESDDDQTGYLTDGWPSDFPAQRFVGEWNQMQGWLDAWLQERHACLDVGCGIGLWLEHFAEIFEVAEGCDLSENMVGRAASRLEKAGIDNARAYVGSILDLPPEPRFDLIFVGGVLMYLDDEVVPEALERLRAALAPGGLIVFRESSYHKSTYYRDKPLLPGPFTPPEAKPLPYRAIYRPARVTAQLLEDAGFELRVCKPNRNYRLVEMKMAQFHVINRLMRGALVKSPARAQRWARRLHRARWIMSWPAFYVCETTTLRPWNMSNHWFVCSSK